MDLGLRGRTAIVCGASAGIGLACAESLAAEGANVSMLARRRDELEVVRLAVPRLLHRGTRGGLVRREIPPVLRDGPPRQRSSRLMIDHTNSS